MKSVNADSLVFAQLSDPHLSSLDHVKLRDLANKRVLGYLSWKRKRSKEHRGEVLAAMLQDLRRVAANHVLVTGDLTNIGLPEEVRQARQWLSQLGDSRDVSVVPGNHDAYARSQWDSRYALWSPFMTSDHEFLKHQKAPSDAVFPFARIRGPVAFIGLSSAYPSLPLLATGRLGEAQLHSLRALLDVTGKQSLFRVLFLHHPPLPGEEKWRKRLIDAQKLCALIAEQGAELVVHGHTHRATRSELASPLGTIPVFGAPSVSSVGYRAERRARYNLYRVERLRQGWSIRVSVRAYSIEDEHFAGEDEAYSIRLSA